LPRLSHGSDSRGSRPGRRTRSCGPTLSSRPLPNDFSQSKQALGSPGNVAPGPGARATVWAVLGRDAPLGLPLLEGRDRNPGAAVGDVLPQALVKEPHLCPHALRDFRISPVKPNRLAWAWLTWPVSEPV
jgi:hypothetical protein